MLTPSSVKPIGNLAGLRTYFRADAVSGFLVFLMALPLCLAIAKASGFPPVAGLLTAIIGGFVATLIGDSELTIKGPAAGLIVVAAVAVEELGKGDAMLGYKLTLATIVVAGVLQVLFGLLRSGGLGDLFPSAAVHGMMAAIGLLIIARQAYVLSGVPAIAKAPFHLLAGIPHALATANPEVLLIGSVSLLILFGLPYLKPLKRVPAPLVVVLVAIPLGRYFNLGHAHTYLFLDHHHHYQLGPQFLVKLPASLLAAVTLPDFSQVFSSTSFKYIVMFALVGSLESLLSTKAIELIDPARRRSNTNRELLAIGVGNTLAGMVGGLPMISEMGRSSANVANGARTRWANFYHGVFLLGFVTFAAGLISQIPTAALAALLIFTGCRLASPKEFRQMLHGGGEQLAIFLITIFVTLATNLFIGIGAGMLAQYVLHLFRGLPLRSTFRARVLIDSHEDGSYHHVAVQDAVVFTNYPSLRRHLDGLPTGQHIVLNLSNTRLVDHTVLENLYRFQADYNADGGKLELTGLNRHRAVSGYATAARTPSPVGVKGNG
jgi:MFS superfamily sulfate permease-like transporter